MVLTLVPVARMPCKNIIGLRLNGTGTHYPNCITVFLTIGQGGEHDLHDDNLHLGVGNGQVLKKTGPTLDARKLIFGILVCFNS
jgi:hypothetical protein